MLTRNAALARLDQLLDAARKAGADSADAVYVGEESVGIGVRMGALEDIGRSEGEEIGLRLFVGTRSAQVSSSDLGASALDQMVERAVAMAAEAPEDSYAGLAPADLLAPGPFEEFDIFDAAAEGFSPATLKAMALEAEDAARAIAGITNSEGGSASAGTSVMALATSTGFRAASRGSGFSVSAVVVAGEGGGMQRDYDYHQARHFADLEPPGSIGRSAGERTIARLNPVKVETGPMPILFDQRVAASLIGHLLGAISGSSIARKTSFLLGHEDEQLFDSHIRIVDDPHRIRGLRSRSFDGEGLPTTARALIDRGRLTGWLVNSASGRQLGLPPTGHASRGVNGPPGVSASNLWLEAGSESPVQLMQDVKLGIYVTELIGMGINGLTGDYSRGAGGFLIRNGQLAEPVSEITIAGNLLTMYKAMVPANDLRFRGAINSPSVRIDGMTVAGQ